MTIHAAQMISRPRMSPAGPARAGQPGHDRGDDEDGRENRERNAVVEILPQGDVEGVVPADRDRSS